jgi:hypothetical protein
MLAAGDKVRKDKAWEKRDKLAIQVDDVIPIRQLTKKTTGKTVEEVLLCKFISYSSLNWICLKQLVMERQASTIYLR